LPTLILEEELRIGSVEDPDYGFSGISTAAVDRDGQAYVYEPQDAQIRVYGVDGTLVRRIGGPGQGPGEFTPGPMNPVSWGVSGDTVWAFERRGKRLTLFNREGRVLSTASLAEVLIGREPSGYAHFIEPSTMDGEGFLVGGLPPEVGLRSQLGLVDSIPVPRVRFDGSGAVVDTAGWTVHRAWSGMTSVSVGGTEIQVPFPLSAEPLIIELADGHIEVRRPLAENSDVGSFQVSRVGFDGEVRYSQTYQYRPVGYAETAVDFIVGRTARWSAGGMDSATAHQGIRNELNVPQFQPAIQRFSVAADGGLWLRREDDGRDTFQWIVLDPEGRPRGTLEIPRERFQVAWSERDLVWAIEQDELGVPWLVRYRLIEG
jgi:hypothetical protein